VKWREEGNGRRERKNDGGEGTRIEGKGKKGM